MPENKQNKRPRRKVVEDAMKAKAQQQQTLEAQKAKKKKVNTGSDIPDDSDDASDSESDPDFVPSEEGDEDDLDMSAFDPLIFCIAQAASTQNKRLKTTHQKRDVDTEFTKDFTREERTYWQTLDSQCMQDIILESQSIKTMDVDHTVPLRFRILQSNMTLNNKRIILSKIDQLNSMRDGSGEQNKLRNWLSSAATLPLGITKELPVKPWDEPDNIAAFIRQTRVSMDTTIYGHTEVKNQIMRIVAQWIANPSSRGHCIGLQGPPGVGKTQIAKYGISQALNLPFGFVALGGASDGSFLDGHSITYEGSTYGKVAEILMKAKAMNPVILFDELDKVSGGFRGEEVVGVLTHLTDPTQNDRFNDKYFSGLELDLSGALMIFSYNDESAINPILKDRMITINVPGYDKKEKLIIAKEYLLPDILRQHNLTHTDVIIPDSVMHTIVDAMTRDDKGVRNLKRAIESIVSWINMNRYLPDDMTQSVLTLPVVVTEEHVKKYMKVVVAEVNPAAHMYC